jgi:hypothetical protein
MRIHVPARRLLLRCWRCYWRPAAVLSRRCGRPAARSNIVDPADATRIAHVSSTCGLQVSGSVISSQASVSSFLQG